ncbi:MAG: ABC transporter permease [Actinomycetota bacterium]|nr:ABC transporter permease [Actinomycetota bacterium]
MTGRLRFLRSGTGAVGAALLVAVLVVALVGPFFSPHAPDKPIGVALEGPTADAPFGTDFLGRDVLSRVLWGGRSVLALAGLATVLAYIGGGVIGLVAGYSRSLLDPLLMRAADVMLSFPALLFLLVLVTGAGTSKAVLVVGVALVQLPLVARIVRTATLEQSVRGFVEAAVARGERTSAVLRREILPNIVAPIMADAGLRFTYSIILVASVNFLGLGLQPPAADWALIISENRNGLTLNPYVILVPAALIAILTIAANLVGDAVARTLGISTARRRIVR